MFSGMLLFLVLTGPNNGVHTENFGKIVYQMPREEVVKLLEPVIDFFAENPAVFERLTAGNTLRATKTRENPEDKSITGSRGCYALLNATRPSRSRIEATQCQPASVSLNRS